MVHPGRIVWTPDLTLTKAVQSAGGFTLYAREAQVTLVRERTAYDINSPSAGPNRIRVCFRVTRSKCHVRLFR